VRKRWLGIAATCTIFGLGYQLLKEEPVTDIEEVPKAKDVVSSFLDQKSTSPYDVVDEEGVSGLEISDADSTIDNEESPTVRIIEQSQIELSRSEVKAEMADNGYENIINENGIITGDIPENNFDLLSDAMNIYSEKPLDRCLFNIFSQVASDNVARGGVNKGQKWVFIDNVRSFLILENDRGDYTETMSIANSYTSEIPNLQLDSKIHFSSLESEKNLSLFHF